MSSPANTHIPMIKVVVTPEGDVMSAISATLRRIREVGGDQARTYHFVFIRQSYEVFTQILTDLYGIMGIREVPEFRWTSGHLPTLQEHLIRMDLSAASNRNVKLLDLHFGREQPDIEFMAIVPGDLDIVEALSQAGIAASIAD